MNMLLSWSKMNLVVPWGLNQYQFRVVVITSLLSLVIYNTTAGCLSLLDDVYGCHMLWLTCVFPLPRFRSIHFCTYPLSLLVSTCIHHPYKTDLWKNHCCSACMFLFHHAYVLLYAILSIWCELITCFNPSSCPCCREIPSQDGKYKRKMKSKLGWSEKKSYQERRRYAALLICNVLIELF